jgi:hypothetical protein
MQEEEDMATVARGPAIATPTPFNGDRTKTNCFLHECELYIAGKTKEFETGTPAVVDNDLKIAFVISYVKDGPAAAWAERYTARPSHGTNVVAPNKTKALDYNDFIREFKETFKEHNKGETTRMLLSKLRQGKFSVDAYNDIFNGYATDANYNDEALCFMYMQGRNESIHNQIMLMSTLPTTLQDLQDKASKFDICCNYNNNKAMDPYARRNDNNNELGSCSNPIHVERRFIKLSDDEQGKLRNENKCFVCKREGHIARFCPDNRDQGYRQNQQGSFRGRGRDQGGYRGNRPWKGRNTEYKVRSVQLKEHMNEFLSSATAEDLNEMAMAIKEAAPVEQNF